MGETGDVFDERFNFRLEIPGPDEDLADLPDEPRAASRNRGRGRRTIDGERLPASLTLTGIPVLRHPTLVFAFEGWNDAGEAASTAARLIVSQRDGDRFGWVDAEEYFVFTETRPMVKPARKGRRRQIIWPTVDFFTCVDPSDAPEARDLIVVLGTEPDLRWRQFADIVLDVARRIGVELVVGLGSLNTDIPHTVPPHVSKSATNQERHPLLRPHKFVASKYRGPTGIVGVLTSRFAERKYPVLSIWGHAPHYISASPNPVVASRMLRELVRMVEVSLDLQTIDDAATRFGDQVREAVSRDPEAMEYVRDLERQYREGQGDDDVDDDGPAVAGEELPSGEAMVDALEEFLRRRHRPPSSSGPSST